MIGGVVVGGYVIYKLAGAIPSKKGAVSTSEVPEKVSIPTG